VVEQIFDFAHKVLGGQVDQIRLNNEQAFADGLEKFSYYII
jgi:hypothetical protein